MFACRAAAKLGGANAMSFTLLLNPDFQRRAMANPDWLRRRLVQGVGSDVPMVMSFGYGGGEVLHVHGVVVLCPSKGSPADEQARITREMEVAGGPWAASHGSEHQVELKPHCNPDYWGGTYLNRNRLEAEGVIARGRSWSMTNPARREAQRQYDQVRRQINGKPGPGDGSPNDGGPRKCTTPDTLSSEPFAERDRIAERRTLPAGYRRFGLALWGFSPANHSSLSARDFRAAARFRLLLFSLPVPPFQLLRSSEAAIDLSSLERFDIALPLVPPPVCHTNDIVQCVMGTGRTDSESASSCRKAVTRANSVQARRPSPANSASWISPGPSRVLLRGLQATYVDHLAGCTTAATTAGQKRMIVRRSADA